MNTQSLLAQYKKQLLLVDEFSQQGLQLQKEAEDNLLRLFEDGMSLEEKNGLSKKTLIKAQAFAKKFAPEKARLEALHLLIFGVALPHEGSVVEKSEEVTISEQDLLTMYRSIICFMWRYGRAFLELMEGHRKEASETKLPEHGFFNLNKTTDLTLEEFRQLAVELQEISDEPPRGSFRDGFLLQMLPEAERKYHCEVSMPLGHMPLVRLMDEMTKQFYEEVPEKAEDIPEGFLSACREGKGLGVIMKSSKKSFQAWNDLESMKLWVEGGEMIEKDTYQDIKAQCN